MSKLYLRNEQGRVGEVSIVEAFPFLREKGHVISLTGGGGKTTLMYVLAEYCSRQGYRTLVTTTTHIQAPDPAYRVWDAEGMERNWEQGKYAVIGNPCGEEKIQSPDEELLKAGLNRADIVFVEADGARHMPCKVPNAKEPVILPESDLVLGVMGLDAMGETVDKVCFRKEEVWKLLQVTKEHRLTEEDAVKILTSTEGTRKGVGDRAYYVVLNKCDNQSRYQVGASMLERLQKQGIRYAVMTQLK